MCLLWLRYAPGTPEPLLVAANRDEFHARPTAALARWDDADVLAGRDLAASGTWMGVAARRRFAALTNVRLPHRMKPAARSRGALVAEFLLGDAPAERYADAVCAARAAYGGFNLLVWDGATLAYVGSEQTAPEVLDAGTYLLSNAALDTPWPKTRALRRALELDPFDERRAFEALRDPRTAPDETLPDTGVGLPLERALSAVFIEGDTYGTRASTVLRIAHDHARVEERSFGPSGMPTGVVQATLPHAV